MPAIVIGGGIIFCFAALVIGGLFLLRQQAKDSEIAASTTKPSIEAQLVEGPIVGTVQPDEVAPQPADNLVEATAIGNPTEAATSGPIARFGEICFLTAGSDSDPAPCGDTFPPVVEMHAIFNYTGMSLQDQWIRTWYHNGQELLSVQENWSGDAEGRFDYNLNTSDGQPLSPGLWQLNLYVNGRLQTFGSFVVEASSEEPVITHTLPSATPTSTPLPPLSTYRLAFTKWDGGKHSVWVANLDGSDQHFLLDFAASPSWSPDGESLTFYGEEGIDTQATIAAGTNGIWRMGKNGEDPTQLLPEGTTQAVSWSPAADLIAFDAARGGPDRRIYFVDAAGVPQSFELLGQQPAWSPDGAQVVAKACRPQCGLWITNRDDTNPRQMTGEGSDGLPAWSPDGRKIAFSRNVDGNVDIFIINVDGSGLQRLTSVEGNDSVPAWTPDGQQIVFRTTRNGLWQIFVMNANGSNQHLIIDNVGASDEWAFDRMSVH